jgi:FtsZ-binding cell division protein ZapB
MIVNPQLFNYRLIISSLLVVLTVLGIFSFTNYKSIKSHEEFLKQEKFLIEKELSEMLTSYDDLSQDYNLIAYQLQEAKVETKNTLDSLRLLKSDLSIITRFKDQLIVLKSKSKVLLSTIDSLNSANIKLRKEKRYALNTIEKKTLAINELEETNDSLNRTIDNAATLKASNIQAQAYKLKSEKKRFTERAKRANAIDVCITLTENPLALKGKKDIYIQIVSPQGNVVSDKGEIVFGDTSLIFSKKEIVNYDNDNLEICSAIIAPDEDQPFLKGYYFINVFHENVKLGSTSIKLK